jgi:hypothetical protein
LTGFPATSDLGRRAGGHRFYIDGSGMPHGPFERRLAARCQMEESTVIKAATAVLEMANWPTKPTTNNQTAEMIDGLRETRQLCSQNPKKCQKMSFNANRI